MTMISCHDCRKLIPAYVSRELPTDMRRSVGAHLDGCEACYTIYLRQREVTHELVQQVPAIGRTSAPQLGKIWNAVQAEMALPRPSSWSRINRRQSIVTIALVLALLVPSLGYQALKQRSMLALPVPPTPTETVSGTSQAVAMTTAECSCIVVSASATAAPKNTIAAQSNYAPNANGTEIP